MGNISDDIILIGASRDDWQPYCNEFTKKKVKNEQKLMGN